MRRGARPVVNEDRRVAALDAIVGVEDRSVNDRSEPLAGGVRRIGRNERVDENLIPVQHLIVIALLQRDRGRREREERQCDEKWQN